MMHIADNQDALLDYLYEEGDPAERVAIATHLQECTRCSVAVLEFQTIRGMLSEWTPPASQLGFRIVQDADSSPSASVEHRARGGWSWGWGPTTAKEKTARNRWAQLAAAVVLFAAGMTVSSQLDVEYGGGALTVRTRSGVPAGAIRNASIELPAARQPEQRPASTNAENASAGVSESGDAIMQRVRAMIEQSENRQKRELALRLSQVASEVDTQHRADLVRIQQDLGRQIEMETGAQQQQMMDYLVRTSGGTK